MTMTQSAHERHEYCPLWAEKAEIWAEKAEIWPVLSNVLGTRV